MSSESRCPNAPEPCFCDGRCKGGPSQEELEYAQKVLGIKRSKQRRVPKDLIGRLKQVGPIEESALCGNIGGKNDNT